jgi:UDP-N-acetylglucosamine:LPS N-acetylglucosamine transferase
MAHLEDVRARYATLGVQAEVLPFIDDMAAAWPTAT